MSTPDIPFRIETAGPFPPDGSRQAVADGRIVRLPRRQPSSLEQQLGEAMNEPETVAALEESGRQAWQQRGGQPCT